MTRPALTEKVHLRLSAEEKTKLRAAAGAAGTSLSDFIRNSALSAADESRPSAWPDPSGGGGRRPKALIRPDR
ncbi:MAG: plasmid mobilization protein [Microvirga sp.]